MNIGERIKIERERRGWSKVELSQKSGISDRSISHYENGERDPQVDTVRKLLAPMGYQLRIEKVEGTNA